MTSGTARTPGLATAGLGAYRLAPVAHDAALPEATSRDCGLTVAELALRWQVSKMTIYRLLEHGHLRAERRGRRWYIPVAAIGDYLARLTTA